MSSHSSGGNLQIKKVGHCGTLDPIATGLLILTLGRGTKIQDLLMSEDKEYVGTLVVRQDHRYPGPGRRSDRGTPGAGADREIDVRAAFDKFRGDFYQMPPMVSAIKQGGVPLYKLARQGKTVEREPRLVHVYRYQHRPHRARRRSISPSSAAKDFTFAPTPTISATRSAAARISRNLRRTRSGRFDLHRAVTVDEIKNGVPVDLLGENSDPAGGFADARRLTNERLCESCGRSRSWRKSPVRFSSPSAFSTASIADIRPSSPLPRGDAAEAGGTAVVVTFDPHPAKILRPQESPRLLTATQHKIALIRGLGVSHLLVLTFDREFAATPPDEFRQAIGRGGAAIARNLCRPGMVVWQKSRR